MIFDLAAYWFVAHSIGKVFLSPDGQTLRLQTQTANGLIVDSDQTGLLDNWQLTIAPQGVLETKDYIPPATLTYKPGYEFVWGTRSMSIGDRIARSTGLDPGPSWGYDVTTLTDVLPEWKVPAGIFHDVAVIDFDQYWCQPGDCSNGTKLWQGRFYLAKGIGIIESDWLDTPDGAGIVKLESYSFGP